MCMCVCVHVCARVYFVRFLTDMRVCVILVTRVYSFEVYITIDQIHTTEVVDTIVK